MLDLTKPIQTKSGFPARILATNIKGSKSVRLNKPRTLAVAVFIPHWNYEVVRTYTEDGLDLDDRMILINVPEEHIVERFVVVNMTNLQAYATCSTLFDAERVVAQAKEHAHQYSVLPDFTIVKTVGKFTK